ncbi:hypothetical protein B0H13DRAFT_2278057 [Mycena leptocephala]|nr:hypothetical protein B0H13DRAFT_2278057 [Mycena leptocephala]
MLSTLAADRARAADIEARILDLERSLAALRLQKTVVQERLDSYKYPVLRLPNEIVSEIFTHFLPIYPLCPPVAGLLSPTVLTHICRKWREIALKTPNLWRAVSLSHHRTLIRPPADLSEVLSRSGCCPLSIAMDDYDYRPSEDVFSAVVAHRERWEHLQLYILSDFPAIEGRLPQLRHVDLTFEDDAPVIVVDEAPLLLTAILSALDLSNVALPWGQLTSLTLDRLEPDDCLPILHQTSNLVHCELSLYDWDYDDSNPPPDVALRCLESLTLIEWGRPLPGYLNTFIVPALQSLRVPEPWLEPNPIAALTSFISKSGCKLRELHLTDIREPETPYHKAFPFIEQVSLHPIELFGPRSPRRAAPTPSPNYSPIHNSSVRSISSSRE